MTSAENKIVNKKYQMIQVMFFEPYPMGLGGNFLTQRMILERLDYERFHPIVVAPVEGVALGRFREMGVECTVISPTGVLGQYGGGVLRQSIWGRLKTSFDLMKYNIKLASFIRKKNINVVYSNCVRAQLSVGFAARLVRVPSLLYIKGELANPVIDYLSFFLADRILFMCKSNLQLRYPKLVKKYKSKISILEGGLDLRELNKAIASNKSTLALELGISRNNFNVCVVGQLTPMKGQHVVIKALSRLVFDFPHIRVYFVGDEVISEYRPYKRELKNIVKEFNLSEYVRFLGWRNDAMEVMSYMDLLINPSLSEGFGYASLEGMGLGLPVIATNVGVLPEAIIDGVNGFLVNSGNYEIIASRWRELVSDVELCQQLGLEARRTVLSKYLIDDKVSRLERIWDEMLIDKTDPCFGV